MKRPPAPEEPEHADRWVVSYADFITLLFAFFVVMYAMSALDARKFESVSASLRSAFVVSESGALPVGVEGLPAATRRSAAPRRAEIRALASSDEAGGVPLAALQRQVDRALAGGGDPGAKDGAVRTEVDERGLVISLAGNSFFPHGSAELRPESAEPLRAVGAVLAGLDAHVRVEGHTDDRPIASARFPSNWELSAARAAAVVRQLVADSGIGPERLSVVGYASHRPKASNDAAEGRARNRRVDLVLLAAPSAAEEPPATRRRRALRRVLERLGASGDAADE